MKYMNIAVSVIIAAAVLIAAYAVGLLVRHARTHDRQPGPPAVTTNEDPATVKAMMEQQRPGGRRASTADANMPAQVKAKREEMAKKMKNMTEEEKRRFTEEQVRSHLGPAGGRGRFRELSPEERQKIMQRWQTLSGEDKKAFEAQMGMSPEAAGEPPQAPSDAKDTTTQQNPEQTSEQGAGPGPGQSDSEPNKAGQG